MLMVMLQMALLISVGVVWRHLAPSHISALSHRRALTDLVFYMLLPALVLDVIWQTPLNLTSIKISLSAVSGLIIAALAMWLFLRFVKVNKAQKGALLIAATFPNCTYLGLPVTQQLFGNWTSGVVFHYDLFACTPALMTVGILLAIHFGNATVKTNPMVQLAKVPPLWAMLIASGFNLLHIPRPELIHHLLQILAGGVVPLMLIASGMSIRWDTFRIKLLPLLLSVSMISLIIVPLAVFGVSHGLGIPPKTLTVVVLLAAMPTMIFGIVICDRYGLDTELYAASVFTTTSLSILTLTLWFHLLS